jgi:hypothetical protein
MRLTNGIAGSTLATGMLMIILLAYIQSEDMRGVREESRPG